MDIQVRANYEMRAKKLLSGGAKRKFFYWILSASKRLSVSEEIWFWLQMIFYSRRNALTIIEGETSLPRNDSQFIRRQINGDEAIDWGSRSRKVWKLEVGRGKQEVGQLESWGFEVWTFEKGQTEITELDFRKLYL